MKIKLITWNVNSIRIRLDLLKKLNEQEKPDVLCIQEVKAKEADFPFAEIKAMGFEHIALYGMAGYNGVAILSKLPLTEIEKKNWVGKFDARHIAAKINDIEINCLYIPAGGKVPDAITNLSFAHKLCFMDDIAEFLEHHKEEYKGKKILYCGDFNVAPLECDVLNHKAMQKVVSHTPVETERLARLFNSLNFADAVRMFFPAPQKVFSWFSYRNPNWQTNGNGRRLDHVWVTPELKESLCNAKLLTEFRNAERPSDHIPLEIELEI